MGRELKRVPLDFEWPLNKPWKGYINQHYSASKQCPHCGGTGESPEARRLSDMWYGYGQAPFSPEDRGSQPFSETDEVIVALANRNVQHSPGYYGSGDFAVVQEARRLQDLFNSRWCHHLNDADVAALVENGRLYDFTHTWSRETGWVPKDPAVVPTAREVNVWSLSGLGHDAINLWVCVKARCAELGVDPVCSHCEGSGTIWPSEEAKQLADEWQSTEPPAGDGFQMWETVSEGSPISPVFATAEELASWLAGHNRDVDKGTSYESWLKFIKGPGWACSFVAVDGILHTGVNAMTEAE